MNRLIIVLLISALLFGSINLGWSQKPQKVKLSLPQAQEFALENNLELKNAVLDVQIANRKVWETTASGLPQVTSGVSFQTILNDLPSLTFPGPGGDPMKIEVGEKANATFSVTASQLIFSGPYIVGLQATKAYKALSENMLAKTERDIKANVASTYYTVLLLEETKGVIDSSVANLKRTLSDTKALQKAGFVEEVVSDQVMVSLTLVENSASETQRALESTKNLLKYQMGVESNTDIELTERLETMLAGFKPELFLGRNLNPDANMELRLVANQIKLSELNLKLEKSNFLPNISAFVTYQRLAKEPQINFTPTAIAGANLSFPIFTSGMRYAKMQQARMELHKSQNAYQLALRGVEMELADATAQLNVAWEKYQSQKANKELAKRVYNNFSIKYSTGLASQQDIIQANDKYLQSVGSYTAAVVELFNARIRVDKVLGNL